ncbi:MAG: hypothetical protein H6560_10010 [Lewinellaceae bacterium]|nr:hypothetical protein [Lewinellaceae bacterium]
MPLPGKIRTFLRYLLLAVGGIFMLVLLLTGLAYYIAVSNQERVPVIVGEAFRENFGAEATFGHYNFQYLEHFPFLSLSLGDVVMHDPCFEDHGRELLRIRKVSVVFRPWKLLHREFEIRSISIDSARIQLFRSKDGYFNAGFLEKDSIAFLRETPDTSTSFSISKVEASNLSFDFEDVLRSKRFRFDIRHARIGFSTRAHRLRLRGDWFFHGLYFKMKNGPYFKERESRVDLRMEWGGSGGGFRLLPSTAVFGQDTLRLEGAIEVKDTNHIRLAISSPGILLENVRPLLADNVRHGLEDFQLSEQVATSVILDGPLLPGQPQPLDVTFRVDSTVLAGGALRFTGAALRGHYVNNCDATGPITPHSDCLDIELLSAKLFDTIEVSAKYHAEDMKAPVARVEGKLATSLTSLNGLLPPGQVRFLDGQVEASFTLSGRMDNPLAASEGRPEIHLDGKGSIRRAALDYLPGGLRANGLKGDFSFDEKNLFFGNLHLQANGEPLRLQGAVYGLMANLLGKEGPMLARFDVKAGHLDFGSFLDAKGHDDNPAGRHKNDAGKGFLSRLEVEAHVNARKVTYRKLGASEAEFTLRLPGSKKRTGAPSLLIDDFSARIFDDIPLAATFLLDELKDPVADMSFELSVPLARLNDMLPPQKLALKSGELSLQMRYHGKLRDYAQLNDNTLKGALQGKVVVAGAAADYLPRGYELRNFGGAFHFEGRNLVADSLEFALNGNQATAGGVVEGFLPFVLDQDKKLRANLDIIAPELDLNRFPTGTQEASGGSKQPVSYNRVARTLESALDKVEGKISVKTDKLHFRTLRLDNVAFSGRLLPACEGQDTENGCVVVDKLSGRLFGTAAFQSSFTATNFRNPFLTADVQVDMPLEELNRMFAPGQFRFSGGNVEVGFHYEGRPEGHFDVENALLKAKLKGEARIMNGAFEYKPRGYRFSEVNSRFSFDEHDLFIEDIKLRLNGNKMQGKGKFYGFLPFLFLPGRELETFLEVSAGEFDFGKFRAPQKFLQPSPGSPQDSTIVTRLVNAGLDNIKAHLQLSIDSVKYRNFRAANVRGGLAMSPGVLSFDSTEMNLCDGFFRLDGQIGGLEKNHPDIDVRAEFRNTDISQVFRSFDNFGQQGMTFHNIRGQLNANIRFQARANANYDLLPDSMKGEFGVSVRNGALISLPALDSLQGFLLRNRRLSNIEFATLENSFELRGQELMVDHFFVASTALSFGVEGRYALGEEGDTNLLFEVPFANLFWQGKEVDALEKLQEKKLGPSILLRATAGEDGGLSFKWVLSKGK